MMPFQLLLSPIINLKDLYPAFPKKFRAAYNIKIYEIYQKHINYKISTTNTQLIAQSYLTASKAQGPMDTCYVLRWMAVADNSSGYMNFCPWESPSGSP